MLFLLLNVKYTVVVTLSFMFPQICHEFRCQACRSVPISPSCLMSSLLPSLASSLSFHGPESNNITHGRSTCLLVEFQLLGLSDPSKLGYKPGYSGDVVYQAVPREWTTG